MSDKGRETQKNSGSRPFFVPFAVLGHPGKCGEVQRFWVLLVPFEMLGWYFRNAKVPSPGTLTFPDFLRVSLPEESRQHLQARLDRPGF